MPVIELRNLKEKIMAKKLVMERHWMKGNVVPLEKEHIDPRMLPLVREHAMEMFNELEKLRGMVENGESEPLDARTVLAVEGYIIHRTHEAIERTLGNPESLMENRFLVKREALERMHERLKPHFETARVKLMRHIS